MKTKNSMMLATALLLISSVSFAQLSVGLRQGIAATTFSDLGDIYDNSNIICSYTAGAFLTLPVTSSLAVQPEINYVRKGRSNETDELNATFGTDFMLHYIQVPVLFQYRNTEILNKAESVFYINAGPYTAFALNAQTRETNKDEGDFVVNVKESNNNDWGAIFGIGFQTPIRQKDVRFDLRYDMGLTEIEAQPADFRTKSLSLTIGILL